MNPLRSLFSFLRSLSAVLRPSVFSGSSGGSPAVAWAVPLFAALGVISAALLFIMNLTRGELNQDEGWYMLAARLVHEGKAPFRDFAFSQGPVLPRVYAALSTVLDQPGLLAGRLFTAFLASLAVLAAAVAAWRMAPRPGHRVAAAAVALLLVNNAWHGYYSVLVKTYALTALFAAAAFLLLVFAFEARRRPILHYVWVAAAGLAFALAAGTRLTATVLAGGGLWMLWAARRRLPPWSFAVFAGAALVAGAALYLPVWFSGEAARFWLVGFHAARRADNGLALKLAFVSQLAQAYLVPSALVVLAGVRRFLLPRASYGFASEDDETGFAFLGGLWISVGLLTLAHLLTPFPQAEYQSMGGPLFVLAAVLTAHLWLEDLWADSAGRAFVFIALFFVTCATAWGSPLNASWFLGERKLIWWPSRSETQLAALDRVAGEIRAAKASFPAGSWLVTPDVYLAVQAGLDVPPGMEMGPFGFFPDAPRDRAERLHVVNADMMMDILRSPRAVWFAGSGYAFAIAAPDIRPVPDDVRDALWAEAERNFRLDQKAPLFGQASTTLRYGPRRAGKYFPPTLDSLK